jgi:DNA-binding NarL/FixJ family response regulator
MPDVDGIEVTRQVAEASPDTKVVLFTSFSDREGIEAALDAGAVGYLLKDAEPEEIRSAIQAGAGPRTAEPSSSRHASATSFS